MDCEQAVALISSRIDHEIQPAEAASLDAHLAECPACRDEVCEFQMVTLELATAVPPLTPTQAVTDRVFADIRAHCRGTEAASAFGQS